MSKSKGFSRERRQQLSDRVLILTLFVQILILVNQSVGLYTVAAQSMQVSIVESTGENLQIHIQTDTGRPNLIEKALKPAKDWFSSYYVGGVEVTNATTALTVTVTGSNVASTAYIEYYIEAVPQTGGTPYRFLEGNNTAIIIDGPSLTPTNRTTIENHLTAMGLDIASNHIIDYYVYVRATATGTVSGSTLVSEITRTKFDTIEYSYGTPVTATIVPSTSTSIARMYQGVWAVGTSNGAIGIKSAGYPIQALQRYIVNIPQGTVIQSAKLQVRCAVGSTADSYSKIFIFDQDTTGTFSTYADMSNRPYYPLWDAENIIMWNPAESWSSGSWYDSPDITVLVQHVLDREGWSSGNALGFKLYGATKIGYRDFYHRYSSAAYGPRLIINYIGYEASWYQLPPLSLTNLPITLDMIALAALIASTFLVFRENRRKMD
jgi:hypothetical protein